MSTDGLGSSSARLNRLPNIKRIRGQYPDCYTPKAKQNVTKILAIVVGTLLCCLLVGCIVFIAIHTTRNSRLVARAPITHLPSVTAQDHNFTEPSSISDKTHPHGDSHKLFKPAAYTCSAAAVAIGAYTQYRSIAESKMIKHFTVAEAHQFLHNALQNMNVDHVRRVLETSLCFTDPKYFELEVYDFNVDKMRMRNLPRLRDKGRLEVKHNLLDAARLWAIYHIRATHDSSHRPHEIILLLAKDSRVNPKEIASWRAVLYEDFIDRAGGVEKVAR